MKRILVNGAGGFIGGHLVRRLKAEGHWVRAVDLKQQEFAASPADGSPSAISGINAWQQRL